MFYITNESNGGGLNIKNSEGWRRVINSFIMFPTYNVNRLNMQNRKRIKLESGYFDL